MPPSATEKIGMISDKARQLAEKSFKRCTMLFVLVGYSPRPDG
jgi:hypothetical protein